MKKMSIIMAGLFVIPIIIFPILSTFATKPEVQVSGVFVWTDMPTWEVYEEKSQVTIMRGTVPLMYTGSFEGPAVGEFVWTGIEGKGVHGRNFHTIPMGTSSLTILLSNSNSMWRVISGTGEYANAHGTGTFSRIEETPYPFDFTYTGTLHYDP
jgi:hypothetical protein